MFTPVPFLQREERRGGGREGEREEDVVYTCMHMHTHTHAHTHTHTCNQLWVAMERCMLNKHIVSETLQLTSLAILWCYRMHTHMLLQL